VKIEYAIDRFAMEAKRQLHLLDQLLATRRYITGDDYTIADIAILPWYGHVALGEAYDAAEFLQVEEYTHLRRWARELGERPAVKRGKMVSKPWGDPALQLRERHDASDFDTKTQDKLGA
jgi:GST-like protein